MIFRVQFFCAADKILIKQAKKTFFGKFWPINCAFSARALSSKLVYFRRLKKISRVRHQICTSQNSTKGDPLGREVVESLEGGGVEPFLTVH